MAGPTNNRNSNAGTPSFNIRPVNNGLIIPQPAPTTFSQVTETPLALTSNPLQTGGGVNGQFQIDNDANRQQSVNIFTDVSPGASTPLTPLSIPANVSGRVNVVEVMEGVSSQPPRAPNSSVGVAPNPIRLLTENDLGEDTYGLPQDVVNAGLEPTANLPSSLRPDIIACTKVNTSYALGGSRASDKTSSILSYMDDVYKLSLAQETLRRTIIANKLATESAAGENVLQTALESIGDNVAADMTKARDVINSLESLVNKTVRIRNVFNLKQLLGSDPANPNVVLRAPLTDLRDFAITRLLYTPETYELVSDTKLLYQVISDTTNVLKKCSFNLVDGFADYDRANTSNSAASTVDAQTYGNNVFSYTPALVTAKYFLNLSTGDTPGNSTRSHTALIGSLPQDLGSRTKFLLWFLTKELRVSKGLGKYLPEDATQAFGGISNVGNPFDNIFGAVPNDIYSIPAGQATIAGLLNVAYTSDAGSTTNRSQRILPFENSNIDLVSYANSTNAVNNVISGESVFVDQHMAGTPVLFRNYRSLYSSRTQAAKAIVDRLLLAQQSFDATSDVLTTPGMVGLFRGKTLELLRNMLDTRLMSPVNAILCHMFVSAQKIPELRFELLKLLCLCYLYGTAEGDTSRFRTILFQELSSSPLSSGESLTVDNLAALASEQLTKVLRLYLSSLQNSSSSSQQAGSSLQYDVLSTVLATVSFTDASVQNILYAAQPNSDPNPFLAVVAVVKELFAACSSTDGFQYQLVPNSSVTRYTGLSASGNVLMVYELFSGLLTDLLGNGTATRTDDDYLQVARGGDGASYVVSLNPTRIQQLVSAVAGVRFADMQNAVLNEEYFVANTMAFLQQIASGMETVSDPSPAELAALSFVNSLGSGNSKLTYASVRTAKNNQRVLAAKLAKNNPNNQRLLNFYVDADNPEISSVDYKKLRSFAANNLYATTKGDLVRSVLSVGIPRGLLGAASDAGKDLVIVRVYRLNSRQEDLAYKPLEFVFDMSLFPTGFRTETDEFVSCVDISESVTSTVGSLADLVRIDPFFKTRQQIGRACLKNITTSYLLRSYLNMLTGINVDDSSVRDISSVAEKIMSGFQTLSSDGLAQPQTVLKEIQPRTYEGFSQVFQSFYGDTQAQNLLLPLTRNISDFIFASRLYDRVFNVVVAPGDFVPATSGNTSTLTQRSSVLGSNSAGVVIDQYYVEVVTR